MTAPGPSMLEAIARRRSVREYKPDPVSETDLGTIAQAALSAPSADNQRPWHLIFVTDRAKRNALSRVHRWASFCAQAPVVAVVCGDATVSGHWWIEDCAAATENAMIQAAALGLGTCWVGIRGSDERGHDGEDYVRRVLGIPSHIRVLCAFSLGHPAGDGTNHGPGPMANVHREQW